MAFKAFNFGTQLGIAGRGLDVISRSNLTDTGLPPSGSGKTVYEYPPDPCFDGDLVITEVEHGFDASPLEPGYTRVKVDCIPHSSGGGHGGTTTFYNPPKSDRPKVEFPINEGPGSCTNEQKDRIKRAINDIFDNLIECIWSLGESGKVLHKLIRDTMINGIRVLCAPDPDTTGACPPGRMMFTRFPYGQAHIVICPGAFALDDTTFIDTLFHELVHYADSEATELDAYMLLAMCGRNSSFNYFNESDMGARCRWCSILQTLLGKHTVWENGAGYKTKVIWGKWFSFNLDTYALHMIPRTSAYGPMSAIDSIGNQKGKRLELTNPVPLDRAVPPPSWWEKAAMDSAYCDGCRI